MYLLTLSNILSIRVFYYKHKVSQCVQYIMILTLTLPNAPIATEGGSSIGLVYVPPMAPMLEREKVPSAVSAGGS